MKNPIQLFTLTSAFLVAFAFMTPSGYAAVNNGGLSGPCNTITDCGTEDFYMGACRPHIETIADCGIGGWTNVSFSCDTGCTGSCGAGEIRCNGACITPLADDGDPDGVNDGKTCSAAGLGFDQCTGMCGACTSGYIMVHGKCLKPLDVVDDKVDSFSVGNPAYKIWDGTTLTETVHVGNAGCADNEIPVSDSASPTGWKCGTGVNSGLWSTDGTNVWRPAGKVGIGTATPDAGLSIKGDGWPASFIYLDTNAVDQDAGIRFYENGTVKYHLYNDHVDNVLKINAEGSLVNSIVIGATGNVGIGAVVPNTKLDVELAGGKGGAATIGDSANTATGDFSVAIGSGNSAQEKGSVAMGVGTITSGQVSFTLGGNIEAESTGEVVIGAYNITSPTYNSSSWVLTDPLFVVANGTSDLLRSNALTILKNGKVGIGTAAPVYDLDVTDGSINAAQYCLNGSSCLVSWPTGAATWLGVTNNPYDGSQGGYATADKHCADDMVDLTARVCTVEDILALRRKGVLPTSGTAWVNGGPPGFTATANDCLGWTNHDSTNTFGRYWQFGTNSAAWLDNCSLSHPFACCK